MKRLIITVPDSAFNVDAGIWRLPDGQGWVGDLRDVDWLIVEDIPDPLPTEPGAVIEATTTTGLRTRLILAKRDDDTGAPWVGVDGDYGFWYSAKDITDWTLLLPGVTP